jgi:hypothetical protein
VRRTYWKLDRVTNPFVVVDTPEVVAAGVIEPDEVVEVETPEEDEVLLS